MGVENPQMQQFAHRPILCPKKENSGTAVPTLLLPSCRILGTLAGTSVCLLLKRNDHSCVRHENVGRGGSLHEDFVETPS